MRIGKSDYTWKLKDDVISLIDLNLGNKSLTNDIENALLEIRQVLGNKIENCKIIYRDSQEIWTGVNPKWSSVSVDVDFYNIGQKDYEQAIIKIKR
jgi:hypothetical protein